MPRRLLSDPRVRHLPIPTHLQNADDSGHFVFDHGRAGEYFVAAQAEWFFADDTSSQWACERIAVGAGQTVRIKVSKDIHHPDKPGLVIYALQ